MEPLARPIPEEFKRGFRSLIDNTKGAFTNALFNALDELGLFGYESSGREKFTIGVKASREVYDNFDLTGTWTVLDRLQTRVSLKPLDHLSTLDLSKMTPTFGVPYASALFEPSASFTLTNVRQVSSQTLRRLPPPSEMESRLNIPEDPNLNETNPYTPWYLIDPSIRARLGKLWNPITFPIRLPLSVKGLDRLADGEMIGYSVSGAVETGVSVGWKVIQDPLTRMAGAEFRVTTVLEGSFQISILKEDKRFARIKLTRNTKTQNPGASKKLSIGIEAADLLKGKLILKGIGVDLKVIPFEMTSTKFDLKQFDVIYRYDLTQDDAVDAYHRAVLGSFALSEELALSPAERLAFQANESVTESVNPADSDAPSALLPAVERIIRRTGKEITVQKTNRLRLLISPGIAREKNRSNLEAKIEMPDGTHVIHRGFSESSKKKEAILGLATENTRRKFTVLLDEEKYLKGDDDSIFIISESFLEDTQTAADELRAVTDEIESFLGLPELFPEFPSFIPHPRKPGRMKRARYGRSSFYYGFSIGRRQIEAFLSIPTHEKAEHIKIVFSESGLLQNIFHRRDKSRTLDRWNEAGTVALSRNPAELYHALDRLFNDRTRPFELMKLIKLALKGKPIDYFVSAQNIGFGRVQERGKIQSAVDKLILLTENTLGFEGNNRRTVLDPDAIVSELSSQAPRSTDPIAIRFHLDKNPKTLFFRLTRSSALRRNIILSELTLANASLRFKQGENEIILDPQALDSLTFKLSENLRREDRYTLTIGYSTDGKKFGPASSIRFPATFYYPSRREDP